MTNNLNGKVSTSLPLANLPAEVDHSNRAHAVCSASSASKWLNCPGSVFAEKDIPEGEPSEYALYGTAFHELCEVLLKKVNAVHKKVKINTRQKADQSIEFVGEFLKDEQFLKYTEEQRIHALEFLTYIIEEVFKYQPKRLAIERRVYLHKGLEMFGTADLFFGHKESGKSILNLYDIKYGRQRVRPDSPQLPFYAIAIAETYKQKFDEYRLHIYQPRAMDGEGSILSIMLTQTDITDWAERLVDGAYDAMKIYRGEAEPVYNPGDHCYFCRAKPICTTHTQWLNDNAGTDFPAVPDREVKMTFPEVSQLTDEQVSKLLLYKREIESYLSAVSAYAINKISQGGEIPGWKVVEGRSQRKWKKEVGDVAAGLKGLGINDPFEKKLRGLGSIEKELKSLGQKKPTELLDGLVERTTPSKSLAQEDDKRPALDVDEQAALDFINVD